MEAVDTVSNKQNASFSTILNDTGDDFDIEVASVGSSEEDLVEDLTCDPSAGAAKSGISVDRADFMIEKLSQLEAELQRLKQENERLAESKAQAAPPAAAATPSSPVTRCTPPMQHSTIEAQPISTQRSSQPNTPIVPANASPGTHAAVQQHRSALSAVLSGIASATLRPAADTSSDAPPRAPASPKGMEGMLKASMAQRRMRLQEGDDDISIASDSSFESPGSAAAPAAAMAAAARRHRRTSTAPSISSPLGAALSPIGPPSGGSVASEGSGARAARRRSSVSGRAKRRLASGASDAPPAASSPLSVGGASQGRRASSSSGVVPLPRAMTMPSAPRLPAPPASAPSAGATGLPARPAGMGALLGAIKSKGGVKGLKKAPKTSTAPAPKGPPAGGLLGAIASFNKEKGLRKAKKKAAAAPKPAPSGGAGGLNPAALQSAAARLNKTPKAASKSSAAAGAAAASGGMRSPFGDMSAIKLRSTGRRAALK